MRADYKKKKENEYTTKNFMVEEPPQAKLDRQANLHRNQKECSSDRENKNLVQENI